MYRYIVGISLACVFSGWAYAQEVPEGEAERQLIREQEQRERQQQLLSNDVDVRLDSQSIPASAVMFPPDESPCFLINDIQLNGDRVADFGHMLDQFYRSFNGELATKHESDDALLTASRNYVLGRCMGAQSINNIMTRLQNQLIERGYVTSRIVAGSQDLSSGVLALTLVPGVVNDITFSDGRYRGNILPMASGDLLNLRDIEQALESMRRLPSVQADINIVPSTQADAQPGDSDLAIDWSQAGSPLRTVASINNNGTASTGEYQGSLSFSYDNLFGFHDITTLSLGHDVGGAEPLKGGTESYSLGFSVPYGYWNASFGASQSSYFQTIQGAFEDYQYSGESRNANLDISRLMYRDSVRKLTLGVNTWYRDSKNFINDTEVLPQRRRTAGVELTANYRQFIQRATVSGSLTYRRGTGMFGSLPAPEEAFGEGSSRPRLLTANAQITLPFALSDQRFQYRAEWRRQFSRERLVTQDHFSIGGNYTVRGFDGERTLLSDTGWLVRNDMSWLFNNGQHSLYLAIDYGEVGGFSSRNLIGSHLAGGAIGVKGQLWKYLSYELSAGRSLSKPDGFVSDSNVVRFFLNLTF